MTAQDLYNALIDAGGRGSYESVEGNHFDDVVLDGHYDLEYAVAKLNKLVKDEQA